MSNPMGFDIHCVTFNGLSCQIQCPAFFKVSKSMDFMLTLLFLGGTMSSKYVKTNGFCTKKSYFEQGMIPNVTDKKASQI